MRDDGVLHPVQITGIVDMAHEVDVGGEDTNGMMVGNRSHH
jgi:hypothetical protein